MGHQVNRVSNLEPSGLEAETLPLGHRRPSVWLIVQNFLASVLSSRWIGHSGLVAWLLRSPDLPGVFFPLGTAVNVVSEKPTESTEDIMARISVAAEDIHEMPGIFQRVVIRSVADVTLVLQLVAAYLSICCKCFDNKDYLSLIIRLYCVLHFHHAGAPSLLTACSPTPHCLVKDFRFGQFYHSLQF
ncbi:hypothetical protein AVEN_109337-1 [Araneus ventricosus]|uniref:Uncharacterized protein n=1 Tax=Araneus ventricosus TaxID=182803 RepID=A0A4Y2D2L4_ARAVE|nr:hypothetical protein AVEN_109337-1 [Araneus ventricosus]